MNQPPFVDCMVWISSFSVSFRMEKGGRACVTKVEHAILYNACIGKSCFWHMWLGGCWRQSGAGFRQLRLFNEILIIYDNGVEYNNENS